LTENGIRRSLKSFGIRFGKSDAGLSSRRSAGRRGGTIRSGPELIDAIPFGARALWRQYCRLPRARLEDRWAQCLMHFTPAGTIVISLFLRFRDAHERHLDAAGGREDEPALRQIDARHSIGRLHEVNAAEVALAWGIFQCCRCEIDRDKGGDVSSREGGSSTKDTCSGCVSKSPPTDQSL